MTVEHVEFLVEEPSMAAFLRTLLPSVLGDVSFDVHPHQSKQDLLAKLPGKLTGYAYWIPRSWRIVVVVDRDDDDCDALKDQLEAFAAQAGLATRSRPEGEAWTVANRIAIEELEAWYFGDWKAVRAAYPRVSKGVPNQEAYRNPDAIAGGTWEAFERELQGAGYFRTGLRKIEAARAVAEHMKPNRNTSKSFGVLRSALRELASA
jgi:hypothetical protein